MKKFHPAWTAAVVTFFTLVATAGFRAAPSVLILPLQDAFGWSRAQISLSISVNVLVYGFTAPFAAAIMEKFGVRKTVMAALGIIGVGALATVYISQPWHLVVLWGLIVGGGTGAMALVFAATIVGRWFVHRRGIVVGVLTAASAAGQLIFLPGLSWLALHHGWRSISLTVGGGAIAMVPLIFFLLKEKPADLGMLPYGAPDDWQEPVRPAGNAFAETIATLRESMKLRDFWILVGSFFVCGLSTSGLVGTHLIAAAHDHGMPQVTAASLLALVGVFDVIGTIGSGWLTDKIDPRKLLFFYYFLRGISLFLLPVILFPSIHAKTLVFVIFYGLDWVATVPPTVILCRRLLTPNRGVVVYGWVFTAHQLGGATAAYGASLLRIQFGNYSLAFYIAGVLCIFAAVAVLQIGRGKVNERVLERANA